MTAEFEHLVEKEHSVMREADFPGTRVWSTTDQRRIRNRMMRRPERTLRQQSSPRCHQAGNGVNRGYLERFVERQRREDPGNATSQHGLAGTRWTDKEQVVPACRGDLESTTRQQLTADIRKIRPIAWNVGGWLWDCDRGGSGIVQGVDGFAKRGDGQHHKAADDGGFTRVRSRQEYAGKSIASRPDGHRQHATCGMDRSVERQFPEQDEIGNLTAFDDPGGRKDAERDWQVERRTRLSDIGRREIHGDSVGREFETRVADRAPHAIPALADARIRQADHRERRQPERNIHFHVNGAGLDADDGRGAQAG
jgi:hypothetical protein